MGILNIEEEFDLRYSIITDESYLVFGDSYEVLEESEKIFGKNNMILLIRNKEQDEIEHPFTMKYIPKNGHIDDKEFYHDGHYGLPITFKRDNLDYWEVKIGDSKSKTKEAERIRNEVLSRKERKFISAVVKELGNEIIDYWEVENINKEDGKRELETIRKDIKKSIYYNRSEL